MIADVARFIACDYAATASRHPAASCATPTSDQVKPTTFVRSPETRMRAMANPMSAKDYDAWQETIYLLRSPTNAHRLMEAVARDRAGQAGITKSLEELQELAGKE
jgi:hypothetical protein